MNARGWGRFRAVLSTFVLAGVVLASPPTPAAAATGDVGYVGPAYNGASGNPSGSKPESKLWFNDGSWWGSLFDTDSRVFRIFRLDLATQTWQNTGVQLDDRGSSRADVLWDGTKLYVASHVFSTTPATGYPSRLYRYSYDPAAKTYHLDPGFPVTINDYRTETLVIEKDSTGTLWATWTQGNKVWLNRTLGDDMTWGVPFVPAVSGTSLKSDDISSLVSFGPGRIGLMWSNQSSSAMYFAVHVDGDPDTSWQASRTAIQGPKTADDHINLKSLESDGTGRVFAIVKTSMTSASSPLIMLLVRDPSTGSWTSYPVWRVSDGQTRPILLLDEEHGIIHVFASSPEGGGVIYTKTSSLNNISFPIGMGDIFIRDAANDDINDVTSTKQNLTSATGLVVLASENITHRYWHNFDPLGGEPPGPVAPTASFSASPTSGSAPLTVSFTDTSAGAPTSWTWDFGDGTGSTSQSPSHSYAAAGTYSVTLTVSNAAGTDSTTATDLVSVTDPPPPGSTLTFAAAADAYVKSTSGTRNYGTDSILRVRDDTGSSSPGTYHSYLMFDVAGISAPVASVTLRLYVTDATPDGGSVYPVSTAWTETGITWNTAPAIGGSALAAIGPTTAGAWVDIPLGASAIGSNGTYAFAIETSSSNSGYYSSREGTRPPQLIVTLSGI